MFIGVPTRKTDSLIIFAILNFNFCGGSSYHENIVLNEGILN